MENLFRRRKIPAREVVSITLHLQWFDNTSHPSGKRSRTSIIICSPIISQNVDGGERLGILCVWGSRRTPRNSLEIVTRCSAHYNTSKKKSGAWASFMTQMQHESIRLRSKCSAPSFVLNLLMRGVTFLNASATDVRMRTRTGTGNAPFLTYEQNTLFRVAQN